MFSKKNKPLFRSPFAACSGPQRRAEAHLDVVVADAHQMVRAGFAALISGMHCIRVIADAGSGEELLVVLAAVKPNVVIVDLALTTAEGRLAIQEARDRHPGLPLLAMTADDSADSIRRVCAAGTGGYLSKSATPEEFETAIRNVANSGAHLSAGAVRLLLEDQHDADNDDELTPRQRQIVVMFAHGNSAKQIAFQLGLSVRTVDVHRARIFHRVNVTGLASLTRYALRRGLLEA
jgi:DNA-binding NarL/FixJ family response regulator